MSETDLTIDVEREDGEFHAWLCGAQGEQVYVLSSGDTREGALAATRATLAALATQIAPAVADTPARMREETKMSDEKRTTVGERAELLRLLGEFALAGAPHGIALLAMRLVADVERAEREVAVERHQMEIRDALVKEGDALWFEARKRTTAAESALAAERERSGRLEVAIRHASSALAGADCCLCGMPVSEGEHSHAIRTGLDVAADVLNAALSDAPPAAPVVTPDREAEVRRGALEEARQACSKIATECVRESRAPDAGTAWGERLFGAEFCVNAIRALGSRE